MARRAHSNPGHLRESTLMDFKAYWSERQQKIETALDELMPGEDVRPATVHKAMRYSIFAGGKRLRPIITLAASEVINGTYEAAIPLACATECIHTYSLIHDDLPCMDDDDMRRGKPTSHKVFGEAVAVLAGDALLTVAFEMAGKAAPSERYTAADYVKELAYVSGSLMLVGGQVADLEGEGKDLGHDDLVFIHERKTAALITGAIRLGAMSANADPTQLEALTEFGKALGLAFQVIDDILDVTQTSEQLGKSAGKDAATDKTTYPSVLGMEKAKEEAERLTRKSLAALDLFGEKSAPLRSIGDYLLKRQN